MPPRVATARLQPRRPPASANLPNKAVPCLLASNPSQKLESRSSLKGNPLSDSVSSDSALVVARFRALGLERERLGQARQHLLRHNLPEAPHLAVPIDQQLLREARLCLAGVLFDEILELALPVRRSEALPHHRLAVDARGKLVLRVVDEGHAAGHAGGEIVADRAENDRRAAGHVFATVGAAALDDDAGARIAHGEALARLAGGEEPAGGRAGEDRVSDDGVTMRDQRARGHGTHDEGAPGEALADIVIGT